MKDIPSQADTRPDLAQLTRMKGRRRGRGWLWTAVLLIAAGAGGWMWLNRPAVPISYDTETVTRGALTVTVIATGTVQPTTQVDISSELSGTIASVEADFNETVTEGQVLARLDDTKLKAAVTDAEAQLVSARARLTSAQATVTETAETLASAEALDQRGLNTRLTYVSAKAAHDRAVAAVEIAAAEVTLAEANLESQRADLDKAAIRSPIDGIVLLRAAEKGQIVAASLNAPVLFTLAEDLTHMELQVAVDEADIGRVAVAQSATFTVDAHPGRQFEAVITSLRYAPDETEGDVVTYTAVLSVENEALLLRPGMTATATIVVAEEPDTLIVPTAALRYAPAVQQAASRSGSGLLGYIMPARPSRGTSGGRVDGTGVYVLRGGEPVRVKVTPGATDGGNIAVTSEDLKEGDEVILSQSTGG